MIYDSKLRCNCRKSKERERGQMGNKERDKEKSFVLSVIIVHISSYYNFGRKKTK